MDNEATPLPDAASSLPDVAETDLSAGFWLRAGGYMIDSLLLAVVSLLAGLFLSDIAGFILRLLLSGAYFTLMPVLAQGQTLGKMAAGVAVVRTDGSALSYGRAFARWFGYLLSALTLCLGFLCAAFTKNKRALQDYVADTRVVRVQELGLGRKVVVVLVGLLFPLLVALGIAATIAGPMLPRPAPPVEAAAPAQPVVPVR